MPKPVAFKEQRVTDDAVVSVDWSFKKQLFALEPELGVVWDWAGERLEIWKFPGQKTLKKKMDHRAKHVHTIQTKDRTYRELGTDILLKLQETDPNRFTTKQIMDYINTIEENNRKAREKAFIDKISSISRDTSAYARNVLQIQVPRKAMFIQSVGASANG